MSASTTAASSSSVYASSAFWERLWRTAGLQSVACFILAYLIYPHQPELGASPMSWLRFMTGNVSES